MTHSTVRRCATEGKYEAIDKQETVIEDHVFIGENSTILKGVRIGHHSVVAAGSVVRENTIVPPYSLVAGVPARIVRDIRGEIEIWAKQGKE